MCYGTQLPQNTQGRFMASTVTGSDGGANNWDFRKNIKSSARPQGPNSV